MFESLSRIQPGVTRCVNAENPTGGKGLACMAASPLGASRKGSPCIERIAPGETVTLAEIKGAGEIRHIWVTVCDTTSMGRFVLRDLVLRMYWDGEPAPSIECPLGDFFCNGFGRGYAVQSLPVTVNPKRGMNFYLPMPFAKGARVTLENRHAGEIRGFFYQIDYQAFESSQPDALRLHAHWHRQRMTEKARDFVLLDHACGRGHYVGTVLMLSTLERYWWGEGEMKFYIDDDQQYPTVCSTGTEDYFGGAWSFAPFESNAEGMQEQTYMTPFAGYPFYSRDDNFHSDYFMRECPPMRVFYRWHIPDPICFERNLRVELQQIGVCEHGLFERQDDVCSVAFWYQDEPHSAFRELPPAADCRPR